MKAFDLRNSKQNPNRHGTIEYELYENNIHVFTGTMDECDIEVITNRSIDFDVDTFSEGSDNNIRTITERIEYHKECIIRYEEVIGVKNTSNLTKLIENLK